MENEEQKPKQGGIVNYFQGATIHNLVINGNMTKNGTENYGKVEKEEEPQQDSAKTITGEQLAQVIENCQRFFWGNSSYAVLFCLLRDEYHMADNQSQFESMVEMLPYSKPRDYICQPGTIAAAFTNTPLFKTNVSEWEGKKPMTRIMTLLSELRKGIMHLK